MPLNGKPAKMFIFDDGANEEDADYTTADYARNGLLDVFAREGKHREVNQILQEAGHLIEDDTSMDPMEIMIRAEEADADDDSE